MPTRAPCSRMASTAASTSSLRRLRRWASHRVARLSRVTFTELRVPCTLSTGYPWVRGSHDFRPQGRRARRQPPSVRPLERRVRGGVQPGHAHGRPRRARGPFRTGRHHRRGGRGRCRAQAQPRPRPHPRVRPRLHAGSHHARLRRGAGLRHRAGDGGARRQQDRPRADRERHRRGRRLRQRRTRRPQRRPASRAHAPQRCQESAGAAGRTGGPAAGADRARGPAQRRAAHRPVHGRAHGDHRAAVGDRP